MANLIPFNRKGSSFARTGAGDFYNMLDDFFSDSWLPSRNLMRDSFKIDIEETDGEYRLEAELPGVNKDEIDMSIEDDSLCISVNRSEEVKKDGANYIHRERRASSMSRRIRLANVKLDDIKAKLEDGILTVSIPKDEMTIMSRKITIE